MFSAHGASPLEMRSLLDTLDDMTVEAEGVAAFRSQPGASFRYAIYGQQVHPVLKLEETRTLERWQVTIRSSTTCC